MSRTKKKRRHLFDAGEKPRRSPRRMMHVVDAGPGNGKSGHIAVFQCPKCQHKTEWLEIETITEGKRGMPCPICNKARNDDARG